MSRMFWASAVTVSTVAIGAAFATAGAPPATVQGYSAAAEPPARATVGSVPTRLNDRVSLLRESAPVSDRQLKRRLQEGFDDGQGVNVDLARAVTLPGINETVAVAPSNGGVCLWVPLPNGESGSSCTSSADALAGHLYVQVFTPSTHASTVVALVPDGASAVGTDASGNSVTLPTTSNLAVSTSPDIRSVRIADTKTAVLADR